MMGKSTAGFTCGLAVLVAVSVIARTDAIVESRTFSRVRQKYAIDSHIRNRRYVAAVPGKTLQMVSKSYQACIAPDNKPGHCRHMSSCGDKAYRFNFPRMMKYMCVIEQQYVGVCCPDDTSFRYNSQNEVLPVGGLAGSLPAIATEGEDSIVMPGEESNAIGDRYGRAWRGCGVSTRERSHGYGGRATSSREWPWMAAIFVDDHQHCGGVLITDRHILTAAHCVYTLKPRQIVVRLGEYDLRYPNETRALDFKVVEIRIHKYFRQTINRHDIAIIKIHRPTIFNTYIWPVCLPPAGAVYVNKLATVIGWGMTEYAGPPSDVLKEATVPVWPQGICASKFVQEISQNNICAGAYDGNGDACQLDSGGPLMHQLSNGRWVTIGIVSWGIRCGEPDRPGIYTRVNAYLDWIFANTVF